MRGFSFLLHANFFLDVLSLRSSVGADGSSSLSKGFLPCASLSALTFSSLLDNGKSQLAGAGSIIWSKCDLPDVPDLTECTALLHTLLPDLPPIETSPTHDFTDFALLQTRTGHLRSIDAEKLNHTALYFCPFHKVERPLTRTEAEWLLAKIVASPPEADGLLRLKGTVPAAEGGFWAADSVLHATGVTPAAEGSGVLYFITRRAQAAGIGKLVERLLEELDEAR